MIARPCVRRLLVLPSAGRKAVVVACELVLGPAAGATGFAINNENLIICGALDGDSGLISPSC